MAFDPFAKITDQPLWRAEMTLPEIPAAQIEPREDVVVVGSGFSGLHTALHLARGDRSVVVIDAGDVGHGCSTRNGGQVSSEIKPDLEGLTRTYGAAGAMRVLRTGLNAHRYLREFVRAEGIACDYNVCGHFVGAHRLDRMAGLEAFGALQRKIGTEAEIVPKARVGDYIDSPHFHGGLHLPDWSSVHPGRLVAELVRLCLAEGVRIVPQCRADHIEDHGDHMSLTANGKAICAENVVMGTDGYTDGASKWMRRRIVSLASVVMATRAMPKDEVAALYPRNSMIYDTRMNVSYHRASPDGDRVVMGTVVPVDHDRMADCYPRARGNMLRVFPQLENVALEHVWSGWVGATFNHLPQVGLRGRMGYAIGYNGTGVAMSAYLGRALARRMLGQPGGETGLDQVKFETRPLFNGQTWYRRPVLAWHDLKDRLPSRGATIG
jgi:glycine/D-amino acid oxidase-like deaminating enzyme